MFHDKSKGAFRFTAEERLLLFIWHRGKKTMELLARKSKVMPILARKSKVMATKSKRKEKQYG